MRFQPRIPSPDEPGAEARPVERLVERPGEILDVLAPAGWTSAQIEAWLDWSDALPATRPSDDLAGALPGGGPYDGLLGGGLARHARRLADTGWTAGLFDTPADAAAFHAELTASMALGLAAPGAPTSAGPAQALALDSFALAARLDERLADRQRQDAAADAGPALALRLQAVMDTVIRCEGDEAACCDPLRNPALGRAARAARDAGASDGLILRAIALARADEASWPASAADAATARAPLLAIAARGGLRPGDKAADRAALAAWQTGEVVLALSEADAEAARRALAAPKAAVAADRFWRDGAFDSEAFAGAVRLWTIALDLEAGASPDRAVGLVVAGLAELLVSRGLAYVSDEGRAAAAAVQALAAAAALAASAELAAALGAYPAYAGQREAAIAGLKVRARACDDLAGEPAAHAATRLFAQAAKGAAGPGLRNVQATALMGDPELSLRLGGLSLAGAPWTGAAQDAEIEDGVVRTLSGPAVAGLTVLGADLASAEAHVRGFGLLDEAPGVGRAALEAKGFTQHEIARLEAGLSGGVGLRRACSVEALGEGFVRDVLGATADDIADPAFDVLAFAGFDAQAVAAAETHAARAASLAAWPDAPPGVRPVFAGAAETPAADRIAMALALEAFACSPSLLALPLIEGSGPAEAVALQARAADAGLA